MNAKLLKIPLLIKVLWELRKKWINKGRRKACKEFEKTLETYKQTIAVQGKLNLVIVKNFVKWSSKVSKKEVSQFNAEIKKFEKLNQQLERSQRITDDLLTKGLFEGKRQKLVMDSVQTSAARSYAHYNEFEELQSGLNKEKKSNRKKVSRIKKPKRGVK